MKYYDSEKVVQVGDRILYDGTPGVIVFVVDDDSYSDEYTKDNWSYLGRGLGVQMQDGTCPFGENPS
jgi:hypothetical protein